VSAAERLEEIAAKSTRNTLVCERCGYQSAGLPGPVCPECGGTTWRKPVAGSRDAAYALIAGFLGWTLDAFDYFLVVIATAEIARDFGVKDAAVTVSITLTLMMRPVGALIFGLLADRYGRRVPMMANLLFYSAVEVATGFAPNLTVFLILRALFGIGMGGEWGVGASLVMEKVSPRWRGVLSGLLQEGYAMGYLLAALTAHFMLERGWARGAFDPHGWRVMFFVGGLPALLAVFVRFFVRESEVWEKTRHGTWGELARGIAANWKIWLYMTVLMTMMNLSSHGTQDKFRPFLTWRGMDTSSSTNVVMIAMVGAIGGGVVFGLASDRFGRRRMMIAAFIGALAAIPLWAYSITPWALAIGAFCMQFMVQGAWGIIPAHISELSPDGVRGFLPGFSYQCGNMLAASIAWVQATAAETHPYSNVLAASAACIFVGAIVVTAVGRERRGAVFGGEVAE
jgi:SHS family lactate transporter-like MFS transporter